MVAVVRFGTSIRRSFSYNENKVKEGIASCIMAHNYPMELNDMAADHRLNMLLKRASLREDVKYKSVHISLNFAPDDFPVPPKHMTDAQKDAIEKVYAEKLSLIAEDYMGRIGFGDQPYLVYKHEDAAHPHIHIVSTVINSDGSLVKTHNIGKIHSEKARKELEIKYGLIKAERHKRDVFQLKPVNVEKAVYARTQTKRAISNVIDHVLKKYKYGSVAELNAVLNIYNVHADTGTEDSRIFRNQGLVYRLLDHAGRPVGVPIKASDFYNRPTLKNISKRFKRNQFEKKMSLKKVQDTVDMVLKNRSVKSFEQFKKTLGKWGIHVAERRTDNGRLYGITYIDHRSGSVFKGSDLGPQFKANALILKFANLQILPKSPALYAQPGLIIPSRRPNEPMLLPMQSYAERIWEILTEADPSFNPVPYELTGRFKKKKKKKRKTMT